ncbi:DUF1983 domain-containing protein [Pseudomonas sp. MWU12-3103b]|uniref:phage tail tip fiber protein n=1 Tax=Pseudomonas sp. MWU12-3103b TaxID=2928857 RepID=UPI001FFE9893|nr:DUF1983 domain-containing protein [Pseudomonas sp. MWU12-3103b]
MQSADYVPGVSGWKFTKGLLEINGGPMGPVRIGDLDKEESGSPSAAEPSPKPFIIVDGVTYIRQESIDEAGIQNPKLTPQWSVKTELLNGQYVAAGIGLGIASQFLVSADRFAVNDRDAEQALEELAGLISQTELVSAMAAQAEQIKPIAETVREVLREELQPGGILHRK